MQGHKTHRLSPTALALGLSAVCASLPAWAELSHPSALQRLDEVALSEVRGAGVDQAALHALQASRTSTARDSRSRDGHADEAQQGSRQSAELSSAATLQTLDQQVRQANQLTASGVLLISSSALVATTTIAPSLGVPGVGLPLMGLGLLGSLPRNR